MRMNERSKDVYEYYLKLVEDGIKCYTHEDIDSGYARRQEEWWYELDEDMTDEEARIYYGMNLTP